MCTIPWTCFINKTLSTDELDTIARGNEVTQPFYAGTYGADELPKIISVNACWIWNTDKIADPGQHWVAVFKSGQRAYFFDSYGKSLRFYKRTFWKNFIEKKLGCEFVHVNDRQFQSLTSTTCGAWCLLWLYYQCWNAREDSEVMQKIGSRKFFMFPFLRQYVRSGNPLRMVYLLENERKLRDIIFKSFTLYIRDIYLTKCKNTLKKGNQICCSLLNFNK